jgi:hypothetical protein
MRVLHVLAADAPGPGRAGLSCHSFVFVVPANEDQQPSLAGQLLAEQAGSSRAIAET